MGEASYRALLIGVPSYKDGAIKDLPFIEQDLAELAQALDGSGYEVDVHDIEQTSRDEIESAVEIFFQEAAPGETLLLFLSGHGIHHNDTDYLVPRGALTRVHDFPGKCVPIDFGPYAERSAAGDVVVFVDACREGIDLREKGVGNVLRWSDVRVRRVGDRHYCHVYACSKGEFARYATAGQNTFSLFSRALSTLVADVSGPSSLGELEKGLQSALDQLTAEHECQRQQVRVRTESDTDTFTVFPRPQSAPPLAPGESLWARLALQHPAWNQVEESPGARLLKETVVNLVDRLHAQSLADRRLLEDDPWSPPGLAERTTERLTWLLSKVLNAEKLGLSPAEASLLVAVPFLSSAFRDRTAARALHVEPTRLTPAPGASPERVGFEQFVAANSRLARRAAQATRSGRTEGAAGIAWWLFHHWLVRHQSAEDRDDALAELLAPVREAGLAGTQAERKLVADLFDGDQLFLLLRGLLASPDFMVDRPVRRVAGASELEQDIRAQLVFALLTIATRSAIDPLALGDIVVDHLGISYAVSLPRLQETLEKATWDRLGRTRVLRAECEHPAVGLALHQQAAVLDGIFSSIDIRAATEQQLAPLEDLPAHATADEVVPALNAQGQRMYESTDLRFRLADDRIQELLMGEELYGDPALAIRELYQNALDACRYRGARTAYLRATDPGFTGRWEGSISFTQGYDDGRAYIECVDNGIGMGKRELREVFSHAGMRFADLPEYTEELARWETENVEFHPNSRFGIGVLSYFMIADDLQVTTCRLDPEGHPGPLLRVDIAGPGALFHIQEIGRGREAGTAVRLYLRDPATAPSAKDLLRRLLWIADYHVTAEDTMTGPDATPLTWLPEVLSEFAPLGVEDASAPTAARHGAPLVAATRQPTTWWCNGMGAVLADGLWCGLPSFGAVVNLTGRHAPQLTVDRKRCIGWDRDHVQRMLHTEIDALLVADSEVLRPPWLATLAEAQGYRLADAILRAAIAADHRPWGMGDHDAPPAIIGCFPADLEIFAEPRPARPHPARRTYPVPTGSLVPDHLVEWRVRAWAKAGVYPGVSIVGDVPLAMPLHDALVKREMNASSFSLAGIRVEAPPRHWVSSHPISVLRAAAEVVRAQGLPFADARRLITEAGYVLPEQLGVPENAVLGDDLPLLRTEDQLVEKHPVTLRPAVVMQLASEAGLPLPEIVARLGSYGFTLPDWFVPGASLPDDGVLGVLAQWGWEGLTPVPPLVVHARATGEDVTHMVAKLEEFGYRRLSAVPPADLSDTDLKLMSRDLDGTNPWLNPVQPIPRAHILRAAHDFGASPQALVERLAQLGYKVPEPSSLPTEPIPVDDFAVLSQDDDGKAPWLEADGDLNATTAITTALHTFRPVGEVMRVWETAGVVEAGSMRIPDDEDFDNLRLISQDLDRKDPWLAHGKPLPLGHVLAAAEAVGREPAAVLARLESLGYHLPEATPLTDDVRPDDVDILRTNGARWLRGERPVPLAHVIRAAAASGRTPVSVARRLSDLGYTLPDGVVFTDAPTV